MCLIASCTCTVEKTYPAIVEITGIENSKPDLLAKIGRSQDLQVSVYQRESHWVIYGTFPDLPKIEKQIITAYPEASVKIYDKPFYVFDRQNCKDKTQAERWRHTIMTANLVADETMQQAYMEYHRTQAEKWPEVATGFCNAGFQQLLVFRNGRQLMLVISIPEGENLDELNPKTTENNPRVDEWNVIMAKYQEGIEGTMPGETWVTFLGIN
jgi:L-rhamnose mutarotase